MLNKAHCVMIFGEGVRKKKRIKKEELMKYIELRALTVQFIHN